MAILTNSKLIAAWPFVDNFQNQYGYGGTLELQQAGSSNVPILKGGPFGYFARFNGVDQFLSIANANIGALNRGGSNVSVFTWIAREEFDSPGFLLGRWDEGNADRQYGQFIDLPRYGGANQICGHVSATGDATTGYPYAIEYSANVTVIAEYGDWLLVGMTYDGTEVISWYENVFEPRPTYTDELDATYSKNPFLHPAGLNPSSNSDFTMGATNLSGGPGSFYAGRLAMPMVFDDALTQSEIDELKDLAPRDATYFITPLTDSVQNVADYGLNSVYGSSAVDSSSNAALKNWCVYSSTSNGWSYAYIHGGDFDYSATPSFLYKEGLNIANFESFKTTLNCSDVADSVKLCVKIGGAWFASFADYSVSTVGPGTDWTNAEEKEFLASEQVLPLTVTPGVELTLSGTPQALPAGNVEGYGIYADSVVGIVRADSLRVSTSLSIAGSAPAISGVMYNASDNTPYTLANVKYSISDLSLNQIENGQISPDASGNYQIASNELTQGNYYFVAMLTADNSESFTFISAAE